MANLSTNAAHSVLGMNSELEWRDILQSLRHGQYDRAGTFFKCLQKSPDYDENPDLSTLITAAKLLCLACTQLRSQAEGSHILYQNALKHEKELQGELCELVRQLMEIASCTSGFYKTGQEDWLNTPPISAGHGHLPIVKQVIQKLLGINPPQPGASEFELLPSTIAPPETVVTQSVSELESIVCEILPASIFVFCLGKFQVYLDGQIVANWPGSKGKSIYKYLVTHREQPVAKEMLMDLFWPNVSPESARRNLNWAIHNLRQILHRHQPGASHVIFQDECYLLNPQLRTWIDVDEFESHIRSARAFEESQNITQSIHEFQAAEVLYHGEFIEEDRYEDWVQPRRQSVQNSYLHLLDRLSSYYYTQSHLDETINLCAKMLAADPCREEAHARLMQCYYQQGYPYLAIRQYQLCVEKLKTELDVAPSQDTTALFDAIRLGKCELPLIRSNSSRD